MWSHKKPFHSNTSCFLAAEFMFGDLPDLSKNQSLYNRFHVIPYRQIHRPGQSVCPGKSTACVLPAFSNALKPSLKISLAAMVILGTRLANLIV